MSLFDVIKYQTTNLGSQTELESLPEDLIEIYWMGAHAKTPNEVYSPDFTKKCRLLATWGAGGPGGPTKEGNFFARQAFTKALSEYNI